jgi:hypothetical protein
MTDSRSNGTLAVLLGLLGSAVGVALGAASTAVYAHTKT